MKITIDADKVRYDRGRDVDIVMVIKPDNTIELSTKKDCAANSYLRERRI